MKPSRRLLPAILVCAIALAATPCHAQHTRGVTSTLKSGGEVDQELLDKILDLLADAVITKLEAKLTLERAAVDRGKIRLAGVRLQNLGVGLRLNSRGAQKLGGILGNKMPAEWAPVLAVVRLGLFEDVEVDLSLKELYIGGLAIDADNLEVEGLLGYAGVTPPDPITGKPRGDSLQSLMHFLRTTTMNRVKLHAGLDFLAAKRAKIRLENVGWTHYMLASVCGGSRTREQFLRLLQHRRQVIRVHTAQVGVTSWRHP